MTYALVELGLSPKRLGALLGVTAVLHTWTRDLRFHPHVRCIVTGGGWSSSEQRWRSARENYLLPVRVLGALFRGKLLAELGAMHRAGRLRLPDADGDPEAFDRICVALRRKSWIVYAKSPFGGAEQVLRYLGRYTHRVGISNHRLVALGERGVTFHTKNGKTVSLDPLAFLDRFVEHVLPAHFVKIRHSGLLAPRHVGSLLAAARSALGPPRSDKVVSDTDDDDGWRHLLTLLTGIDPTVCAACGAHAVVRQPLASARAPPRVAA